ncbi:hypothetical protein [Streptomyces sp. NPDC085466]|uniref:hypothetical protein n=1 Tax=Streptomyces sp. NPDC085466 TaxID=3365725 RepID=UPI0037CDEA46
MRRSGCEAYVDELTRIAARDRRVVRLAGKADGRGHPFELAHADRLFDLNGVEAAMAGVARGLAVAGFRQFVAEHPQRRVRAVGEVRLRVRQHPSPSRVPPKQCTRRST